MDPEMLQEFKERQAKITSIQSSLQSGDLKSGYVFKPYSCQEYLSHGPQFHRYHERPGRG